MKRKNADVIYKTINEVAEITGLSSRYIRNKVKNGEVPYVMSGSTYMLNYNKFMEMLEEEEALHS